jgi:hypothetical protein
MFDKCFEHQNPFFISGNSVETGLAIISNTKASKQDTFLIFVCDMLEDNLNVKPSQEVDRNHKQASPQSSGRLCCWNKSAGLARRGRELSGATPLSASSLKMTNPVVLLCPSLLL